VPRRVLTVARRWAAFLLVVASLVPSVIYRSWIDAQTAAFTVLATTIDTPVLNWIAAASTDGPRVDETQIAGQPATIARPGSGKRWPAVVFVNGATERGHLHPEVQRLARGLARAGFLVVVPELPGLRRGQVTLRTLSKLVAVARATADEAMGGRVGFVGVSVGASLALAAAEQATLRGRISAIAGIAPYADLREVTRMGTTHAGYAPDDFVQLAVARSLAAALPSAGDRRRLVALFAPIPNERDDPLRGLRPRRLGRQGRALMRLLRNRDSTRFDALWRRLPPAVTAAARRLSPVTNVARLDAPVALATSPDDKYFPVAESRRLGAGSHRVDVTVTSTLSHAIPEPSLHSLGAALAFDGWVVRALQAIRS
jgi:pimeloyl-ACP methyl ester carboxylesterase